MTGQHLLEEKSVWSCVGAQVDVGKHDGALVGATQLLCTPALQVRQLKLQGAQDAAAVKLLSDRWSTAITAWTSAEAPKQRMTRSRRHSDGSPPPQRIRTRLRNRCQERGPLLAGLTPPLLLPDPVQPRLQQSPAEA